MTGRIVAVYGNLVVAQADGRIIQNSVGYCLRADGAKLLSEVIRVRGRRADLQVFEETCGLKIGDTVEFETSQSKQIFWGSFFSVCMSSGSMFR